MHREKTPIIDLNTLIRTRDLVLKKSKSYDVHPLKIVGYTRGPLVDQARREIWQIMIGEWGLRRHQVATIFKRDVRRLRKSVIGI
jgi:hypothetical protein